MKQQLQNIEIKITHQEQQIIARLIKDYQRKNISDELHIAPSTLDTEQKQLYKKINRHSAHGIVGYALTHGFVYDFAANKVYYLNQLIC